MIYFIALTILAMTTIMVMTKCRKYPNPNEPMRTSWWIFSETPVGKFAESLKSPAKRTSSSRTAIGNT